MNDISEISNVGTATISTGQTFTVGEIDVANPDNAYYGVLVQTGGTINVSNWYVVGRFANGENDFSGGTINKTGGGKFLVLGGDNTQPQIMRMSGTAAVTMSNSGVFAAGDSEYDNNQGNAQLFIHDSASINTGGAEFWVGNNTGCNGYVSMSGGTITDSSWISVGRTSGTGGFNFSGRTINKTGNNSTHFIVGDSGTGALVVFNQTGGTLNSAGNDFWLGSAAAGIYNISGGAMTTAVLSMGISAGSSGTLNLNGGSVSVTHVQRGSGSAVINFNGGVLQALTSNASFIQNFNSSQISVQTGGVILDTGGFTNTISVGLQGPAGFTLQGSGGSVTLSASNSYAGDTTVNEGTPIIGPVGTLGAGVNVNLGGGALGIPSDATVTGKRLKFNGGTLQFQNYNSALSFINVTSLMLGAASGNASSLSGSITGSGSLTYTGPGNLNLAGNNNYTGGTTVTGGMMTLASAGAFPANSSLVVASGAKLAIANHGTGAVIVPLVSTLNHSGTIDITNNGMVVLSGSYSALSQQIAVAYNNGKWNGINAASGVITSSVAAGDPTKLTAVGIATGLTAFEGSAMSSTDVCEIHLLWRCKFEWQCGRIRLFTH